MIPLKEIERVEMKKVFELNGKKAYLGFVKSHTPFAECGLFIQETYEDVIDPRKIRITRNKLASEILSKEVFDVETNTYIKKYAKEGNEDDIILRELNNEEISYFHDHLDCSDFQKVEKKFPETLSLRPFSEIERRAIGKIYR